MLDGEVRRLYAHDPGVDRAARAGVAPAGAAAPANGRAAAQTESANDEIPVQLTQALAAGEDAHESTGPAEERTETPGRTA